MNVLHHYYGLLKNQNYKINVQIRYFIIVAKGIMAIEQTMHTIRIDNKEDEMKDKE